MRRLVDTTLALVRSGEVSHQVAAVQLLAAGVPVAVIGRVLTPLQPLQPLQSERPAQVQTSADAAQPPVMALLAQAY